MSEPTPGPAPGEPTPDLQPRRSRPDATPRGGVAAGLALAAVYGVMLALSWRRWADPVVDYGRELYQAWRMAEGARLYVDVASLFGPLASLVNALWCRLFGATLSALAALQLALIALLTFALYRFFRPAAGRLAATLAGAAFLVCFAFAHSMTDHANYDFVCPYTHAATHGLILLVLATWALARALEGDGARDWALGGLGLGGALLTKPEHGLAAGALAATALAWRLTDPRPGRGRGPAWLAAGAAALPLACALTLGPTAVVHAWLLVRRVDPAHSPFYALVTGMDAPLGHALAALLEAGLWGALVWGVVTADRRLTDGAPRAQTLARLLGLVGVGLLLSRDPLFEAPGLTVFAAVACPWLARDAWRGRRDGAADTPHLVRYLLWSVLSLTLLAKIALRARLGWYGFYLALPATLLAVTLAVGELPRRLAREQRGWLVRFLAPLGVGMFVVLGGARSALIYVRRTAPVGEGPNLLWAHAPDQPDYNPNGALLEAARAALAREAPHGETLAVLPEGALLNVLTGRRNPTPYEVVMPPELASFGEEAVVEAYRAAPPDHVVVLSRTMREYGGVEFGSPAWAPRLGAWLRAEYEPVTQEAGPGWHFTLYRRRSG